MTGKREQVLSYRAARAILEQAGVFDAKPEETTPMSAVEAGKRERKARMSKSQQRRAGKSDA